MAETRSAGRMVKMFQDDPKLVEDLKTDPIQVLKATAIQAEADTPIYYHDVMLYRVVVLVLGLVVLIAAIGSIILVVAGKTTPEVLVALGAAAVGALAGLFAPSPAGK